MGQSGSEELAVDYTGPLPCSSLTPMALGKKTEVQKPHYLSSGEDLFLLCNTKQNIWFLENEKDGRNSEQ